MRSIRCVAGGIKVGEGWGGGRPWEGPGRMMSMAARMGGVGAFVLGFCRRGGMSASKRTSDLGEPTLERREFLSVGGATIAGAAIGGGEGVGLMDETLPDERRQEALADVEAMTFDVFGTVVDWRTSIIR